MKPTIVVAEQLRPPKFTFINWLCLNCNYENMTKVKLEDITYALECSNCGAEYKVKVTWSQSSTQKANEPETEGSGDI